MMAAESAMKKRKVEEMNDAKANGPVNPRTAEIKKWLSGMTRDVAINFLAELATVNQEVLEKLQEKIRGDPTFTKLFVRSLDWNTTDQSLHDLFSQYGEIQEAVVLTDQVTGKSKGFGFVTFTTAEAAQAALQEPAKMLDGREISCHLAAEKNVRASQQQVHHGQQHRGGGARVYGSSAPSYSAWTSSAAGAASTADRRLFVRGLAWETTTESLQNAFSQYGPILEAAVISDRDTGRSKGYGFVTFQAGEGARAALVQPDKYIDGRLTSCNYAVDRPKSGAGGGSGAAANGAGGPAVIPQIAGMGSNAGLASQLQALQAQQLQLQQQLMQQQQQRIHHQQQLVAAGGQSAAAAGQMPSYPQPGAPSGASAAMY